MNFAAPPRSTRSLAFSSLLCLAACTDDGAAGTSFGPDTSAPGTESSDTDSASGSSDSDSASGNSDSDSNATDSDTDPATDSDTNSASATDSDTNATDSDTNSATDTDTDTDTDTASASNSGTGNGPKFDLGEIGDLGEGGEGIPGPGSCRSSEIYGASGGFPTFEDPAFADFLDRTIAIVTHRRHGGGAPNVLTVVDISGEPPPPNMYYAAPLYWQNSWDEVNLGKIFGLTLDSYGNIYVASTTVYGANNNPGRIQKIDGVTGEISNFITLPNNGPALGNINYDCVSETIYASNHDDGRIYQIDMDGDVVSTYHHGTGEVTIGLPNDNSEPDGVFAPLGERVWAVQSHAGRLYYGVWWEHYNNNNPNENNAVWSVAYVNDDGIIDPATAKKELEVPNANSSSQPVSDISFAHDGWMLVAQRSMYGDAQTTAHQSTTFDYDYQDGEWVWQGTNYVVGELQPYSAAGGVDHDFVQNGYVWMTGDALDFYTPDVVYGLQGTPYGGGDVTNSTLIDLDHEVTGQDKTVYGDVELPIPGDVNPVPPPA